MKISVCGKGESGKSTVVALLAKAAQQRELSVVVVDSDESKSSLFKMLGFEYPPAPLLEMVGGKASLKEKIKSSEVLIEADGNGFWLIDLFGERRFVAGKIQSLNLTDGQCLMMRKPAPD